MAKTAKKKGWEDGVGKRCWEKTCRDRKCGPAHPYSFKIQWKGDRKSGYGAAAQFMFLWRDHQLPPQTMTEAKMLGGRIRTWLQQGKQMPEPEKPKVELVAAPAKSVTINTIINGWLESRETNRTRTLTNKGSIGSFDSKVNITRSFFGDRPVEELEAGACVVEFIKLYASTGRKASSAHGVLASVLRPASLWAAGQETPLITKVPFGKHRIKLAGYATGSRDTRITPHQEAHLLDAAGILDDKDFQYAGRTLHDFIVLSIDLGPRPEELFTADTGDIDWQAHRLTFRNTKYQGETRVVPFNPHGRAAEILQRRRRVGIRVPILCDYQGAAVSKVYRVWVHGVCIANNIPFVQTGSGGRPTPETMEAYTACNLIPYSGRHEFATWLGLCECSDETADFIQGHKRQTTHGRYKHEQLVRATAEMREKVWPREHERAQFEKALQTNVG